MVAAQPAIKFNNSGLATSNANYLQVNNRNTAFVQPVPQYSNRSTTVNFGSATQGVKFGSHYDPPRLNPTPSNHTLNINTNYVAPTFTTSHSSANLHKLNLN